MTAPLWSNVTLHVHGLPVVQGATRHVPGERQVPAQLVGTCPRRPVGLLPTDSAGEFAQPLARLPPLAVIALDRQESFALGRPLGSARRRQGRSSASLCSLTHGGSRSPREQAYAASGNVTL